jgi:hypothetical protein
MANETLARISCKAVLGVSYISGAMQYECLTRTHLFYFLVMILPIILVILVMIPAILYKLVKRSSQGEQSKLPCSFLLKYGTITLDYRSS